MLKKLTAALLSAALIATVPAIAYAGQGNGKGGESSGRSGEKGGGSSGNHGKSGEAHGKAEGKGRANAANRDKAPGHQKSENRSARAYAPGQVKKQAVGDDQLGDETTASIGRVNFGTVISSIRAGKSSLNGVTVDTQVTVVDVSNLVRGNNRVALANALAKNQISIETLRDDLASLGIADLTQDEIDSAVAARRARDGSLVVFVDRD
ncbi:hypothetical protein KEU06_27240 [Pseudaminobacter sp. 19-2017]|uniref:Uncharacterized protein n=1 Tax=Pseudaminobacter soli (ex Zhang et al. 2022) TaxID=2831468 RepID=A0A942E2J3_9HYPH|nr:hypothetical protein [Pseudaminobacter soli]MBS3652291.1 hypothetical protein [Pseudaminobacter soli]